MKSVSRANIESAIATYLRGFETGEVDAVPFADDVVFVRVSGDERFEGAEAVREFLGSHADKVDEIEHHRDIVDGPDACTIFTLKLTNGVTATICDHFRFKDNEIAFVRPYFDPRPMLAG